MKLDAYKQLNNADARQALTLMLNTANDETEHPEDADRFRNRSFKDNSWVSCKQKLIKKSLVQPYEAMLDWLNSRLSHDDSAYNPRMLLPNPTPLWDNFVSDLISRMEHNPSEDDKQLAYKQVCSLAASATNHAKHNVLDSQKRIDWIVTSHEYNQALAPKVEQLADYIYTNFIRQ